MNPSAKSPTVKALFGQNQSKPSVTAPKPLQTAKPEAAPQKTDINPCCSKTVLRCFRLALDRWHPKKPGKDVYRGREYKQLCEVYKTVFGKDPEEF